MRAVLLGENFAWLWNRFHPLGCGRESKRFHNSAALLLGIGTPCRRYSADTLRFYERRGLLPTAPRSTSGYRLFPAEALPRVQLIRRTLSIGFSVAELSAIFRERDCGGAPCQRVRELAADKLSRSVFRKIATLRGAKWASHRHYVLLQQQLRQLKAGLRL